MRKKELSALSKKRIRSGLAAALAVVLSVPAAAVINNVSVSAGSTLPNPIAVYDMSSTTGMTSSGENAPQIVTDAERGSVLQMQTTTSDAVTMSNPFAGRTSLAEWPTFSKDGAPVWEKGVTISYWLKATETDSSLFSFNLTRDEVLQKDDKVKYEIMKWYESNPEDPVFAIGKVQEITFTDGKYNGKTVNGIPDKSVPYKVRIGIGIFARFNQEYAASYDAENPEYYLFATSLNSDGSPSKYELKSIGTPYKMEEYGTIMGANSKIRYGTEKSGLQFNSSGAWGFTEGSNDAQYYTNGVQIGQSGSLNSNSAQIYSYVDTTEGQRVYQDASPIKSPGTWHYVSLVIKNDSISTYIDGQLKDEQLYTTGSVAGAVYVSKAFNLGYGYYTSTSDSGLIYSPGGDIHSIAQGQQIATPENGKYFFCTYDPKAKYPNAPIQDKSRLGYTGNTLSITLMEMITNPNTTLQLGGTANSMSVLSYFTSGSIAGTCIDSIAFYTEPLDADQIAELYNLAKTADPVAVDQPVETRGPQPTPTPTAGPTTVPPTDGPTTVPPTDGPTTVPPTDGPTTVPPTDGPTTVPPTDGPTTVPPTDGPTTVPPTDGPTTVPPTTPPTNQPTGNLGDVTGDNDITLDDVNLILKYALTIQQPTPDQKTLSDVNKDGDVDLDDVNLVLKYALTIIDTFD